MGDVTQILSQIEAGDSQSAEKLLPLVYEELRRLAAQKMAWEKPGQTLGATALVHEAYVRLVDVEKAQQWDSRAHFFGAAAEAMRRILIEAARRKKQSRNSPEIPPTPMDKRWQVGDLSIDDLLDIDEALSRLEANDPATAQLVKLRYFAGFTMRETADALGIPLRTAERNWTFARTWLHRELNDGAGQQPE